MNLKYYMKAAIAAGAASLLAFSSTAWADDKDNVDLKTLSCRDYLKMDSDERGNTTVFIHGYITGKKAQTIIVISKLSDASDKALESCIDRPDASLLATFEEKRG